MSFKSNNKVNLAVIGCGNIARFHIPAMREVGFNIVAIAGSLDSKNALKVYYKRQERQRKARKQAGEKRDTQ